MELKTPKPLLIVFNPHCGGARGGLLQKVLERLNELEVRYDLYETHKPGDARDHLLAMGSLSAKYDTLVAAGGDGTINEVVNGCGNRIFKLGIVPLGTTNVLACELGLSARVEDIVSTLTGGRIRTIYAGVLNGRRFLLMAGIGFDADVVKNINLGMKQRIGKLAYLVSLWRQIFHYGNVRYDINVDGVNYQGYSVLISKAQRYGGKFILTRNVSLDSPELRVLIFTARSKWRLLHYLLALPLGIMENIEGIQAVTGRRIQVSLDDKNPLRLQPSVQIDGDAFASLPASVKIDMRAIPVLVPSR